MLSHGSDERSAGRDWKREREATAYNPPGYAAYLEGWGLAKAKDLLCWEISMKEGYRIPERILRLTDSIRRRYGLTMRRIDLSRYDDEVRSFAELSIATLSGNWGFSPITEAEVAAIARDLKPVLRPECVLFATDREGRDVGFALTLPDVNQILARTRGRMFPTLWARLLFGIPRLRRYRMFGLGASVKALSRLRARYLTRGGSTPHNCCHVCGEGPARSCSGLDQRGLAARTRRGR